MPYGRRLAKRFSCLPEQTPVFSFPQILPFTLTKKIAAWPYRHMPTIPFLPSSLSVFPASKKTSNTRKEVNQTKNLHALLHWRSLLNLTTAAFSLIQDFSPFLPAIKKPTYSCEEFKIPRWSNF